MYVADLLQDFAFGVFVLLVVRYGFELAVEKARGKRLTQQAACAVMSSSFVNSQGAQKAIDWVGSEMLQGVYAQ
jgi:hypothetical protein